MNAVERTMKFHTLRIQFVVKTITMLCCIDDQNQKHIRSRVIPEGSLTLAAEDSKSNMSDVIAVDHIIMT